MACGAKEVKVQATKASVVLHKASRAARIMREIIASGVELASGSSASRVIAVLKTLVIPTPMTKKKATSRKSAVADWMESRSLRGKLAVATMLLVLELDGRVAPQHGGLYSQRLPGKR